VKPVEVQIKPKRVVMPAAAPQVETDLPGGASLAKEIVDIQLRAVKLSAVTQRFDPEAVKALKDMASVYEMLAKIERDERREDKFGEKLKNMSEAELDALIAAETRKQ
jgi:hypothetical protein